MSKLGSYARHSWQAESWFTQCWCRRYGRDNHHINWFFSSI